MEHRQKVDGQWKVLSCGSSLIQLGWCGDMVTDV